MNTMTERMIAWAEKQLGNPNYASWCLSFIEDALEISNNIEIFGGASARESCDLYFDAIQTGLPERGAYVFYDCICMSEDGPVNWGHCGISLGDGRIIHAWAQVQIDDYRAVETFTSSAGDHPRYIGWVPLSRVLQQKRTNIKIEPCIKESFAVIGREGSTEDGPGFIQNLWQQANSHFEDVAPLARRDENGTPLGFWGAMSDLSRSFRPWDENFTRGLYLAGVECEMDATPPAGWVKWVIPGYEYLRAECDREGIFPEMIGYLEQNGLTLAGAVHDFTCPGTGKNYMYFPIRHLGE